jgi:8-oxo-dGTP diphosphatase
VPADTTLREAALATLARQTGVRDVPCEQLYTFDRQPDGVCVAYLALIAADRHPIAPGPDEVEVRWFAHDDLPALDAEEAEVLAVGLERLRAKTLYAPIALQLLPETFTLGEVQAVYEAVLSEPLDARNFRRDLLAAGAVEPLDTVRAEGRGRPARLYRAAPGQFAVLASERRAARAGAATRGSRRSG